MWERGGVIRERLICLIVLVAASFIVKDFANHFQFGWNGMDGELGGVNIESHVFPTLLFRYS